MSVEINKDIDKFQESVVLGLTAKQLIASILSVLVGGIIVFLTYKSRSYVVSIYSHSGGGSNSFKRILYIQRNELYAGNEKRIQFMFKAKPLLYKSTENAEELKKIAAQIEEEKERRKRIINQSLTKQKRK